MGQYYRPIFKEPGYQKLTPNHYKYYIFDSGFKLMENSWLGNTEVEFLVKYLVNNPKHVVWAGDYADEKEHLGKTEYSYVSKDLTRRTRIRLNKKTRPKKYRYILNHTKQEYIDLSLYTEEVAGDRDGWIIHPLPLLTADGNGRGGGDYRGPQEEYVGLWKDDLLEVKDYVPNNFVTLYFPIFFEDR